MTDYSLNTKEIQKGTKCIVAGLFSMKDENIKNHVSEVTELIQNKGGVVVGSIIQRRGVSRSKKEGGSKKMSLPMNAATFIGSGKANELKSMVDLEGAEIIVFLNKLTTAQKYNLYELTDCTILSAVF